MKKVILEQPEVAVIELSNVNKDKYYGIIQGGAKGFVTRKDYDQGVYYPLVCESVTNGNTWNIHINTELKGLVRNLISNTSFTVYEFDTSKELFSWLAE